MQQQLTVDVVTPDRVVMSQRADSVRAPSVLGQIGVFSGHRALLAELDAGELVLGAAGSEEAFAVSGGFIKVNGQAVTVLAESVEAAASIDVQRAFKALQNTTQELKQLSAFAADFAQVKQRQKRAQVRLDVAKRYASA